MDGDNFLIFNPNFNPIKPNLENSMLINPNFPAASPDSGFSSFGSRSFNDRISQLRLNNNELEKYFELNHVLGNSKLGRVSSTPLRSDSSRTQMEIRAKIASPNEGSSVSEQNIIRETEEKSPGEFISRKRKPFSKGKPPKEVVDEHDNRNSKRCKISKNKKNANDEKQDDPLKDYIHVRARRGQATDSHSLAERVRREKISERMKLLQDLVPGCNKATGKALMLDEIINYVQSLQHQVEFLSMKLATVDPLDFISDSLLSNDVNNSTCLLDSSYLFGQQKQETRQTKNDFSTHCIQLPFVDDISQEFPQLLGSYEDDLQSIVQMGFEHNLSTNPGLHSQNFPGLSDRSKMSIKL